MRMYSGIQLEILSLISQIEQEGFKVINHMYEINETLTLHVDIVIVDSNGEQFAEYKESHYDYDVVGNRVVTNLRRFLMDIRDWKKAQA